MTQTKIFGVCGNPVLHSKSPCMFNHTFAQMNIDASYLRVAVDSAEEAIKIFRDVEMQGMNVTSPFKEDMICLLDEVSEEARLIGGVNVIVNKNGKLHGYNTDHYGVADSILQSGIKLEGINAIVIGAGGAGRAAAYGLIQNGAKVTIINRTEEKAKNAAQVLKCQSAPMENLEEEVKRATLIVMSLSQNINPVKNEWLKPSHLIFDANYKGSPFEKAAQEIGCTLINGEDWLLNQAIPAFKYFLNIEPDRKAMKQGLSTYDLHQKLNKISLIGFMAAGKTKNSNRLGAQVNRAVVDTDDEIVKNEKITIPEIFATKGEAYFRQSEAETLKNIIEAEGKHIISCGGGIVVNDKNREYLKNHSLVVWLFASPEAIVARLKPGKRPLLDVPDPLAKARELLSQRLHFYARTADVLISTERNIKEQTTQKIYDEINTTFGDIW